MSDPEPDDDAGDQPDDAAAAAAEDAEDAGGPVFSGYGIASAALGLLSVGAVVLGGFIWSAHRDAVGERVYLSRVMQTAADWTGVLINMNSGNIDTSLQKLHDGTVGDLNADFDAAMQPYRLVVQKLQSQSAGRIDSVAIETVRHDLDTQPGGAGPPRDVVTTKLPPFASRTDTVMLVATSVSENVGAKPQTVHWNLRLAVSDVDGKLMISGLESIR
ncbi:hypothetical protein [Mycobacterium palustre]|uniref:Mammalian cell entry protein n=1 Tax=Mycobacterium palustre TaxID=153971 RepID=A0A1X1ZPK8_9MYCO|nr:hypothetical protein [Mycobacterium palustre]MCV7099676.1 hypothetical protein [Mycobacterium palustre]ORW25295.1 hypothetical protein AWC19_07325 [Mycobacterium palustre]ORW25300.1 hypothetical protein AWC19_07355 [Mycobacterium palustre]